MEMAHYSTWEIVRYKDVLYFACPYETQLTQDDPDSIMIMNMPGGGVAIRTAPRAECEHVADNEAALMAGGAE